MLHVPERQLGRLRTGLEAQLVVDAISSKPIIGRIKRISPVVDPATALSLLEGGPRPGEVAEGRKSRGPRKRRG